MGILLVSPGWKPWVWPGQGVHHPPHHPTAPPHPLGTHRTVTARGTRSGDLAEGAGKPPKFPGE